MRRMLAIIGLFALVTSVIVCGDSGEPSGTRSFLVVVESSLREPLRASLDQYVETMELAHYEVHVEPWAPKSTEERDKLLELRTLLFDYVDSHGIEGALLVGDLPALMYEMPLKGTMEEFPTDIFLQDRDAVWPDTDNNGYSDAHSELEVDIYTSRLLGTEAELVDYFARAERYRREGPLVDRSAYIFIDDDWSRRDTSDTYHLNQLYSEVDIVQAKEDSSLVNYIAKLTGDGAEFVYQWVHGAPPGTYSGWLAFDHLEEQDRLPADLIDIDDLNLKVSFVNMANCYGARFTDEQLSVAEAYTFRTDYGLAVIGSTKTGALADPRRFHESLAPGKRWGEAYNAWFTEEGMQNESWHLGIVLMGDPLLQVTGDRFPSGTSADMTLNSDESL